MKSYIDKITSGVTMYRGVVYSLTTLLVFALTFSIFGLLSFDPLELFLSAVVLVCGSVIASYALAYIFGARAHIESAVITGLILVFIFSPARSSQEFTALGLIAVISAATKYIIAWRGRHIINPAAGAAVIASLLAIQSATWWVATPAMIIPTIIFGTFLLYKTNRLVMGYLYIVVAAITTVIVTLAANGTLAAIIPVVLISYPILYLAFFMLSEPLTQAPRSYQRNLIAVGIAILASLQLTIYSFSITPEVALVIGNTVAFFFTQRGGIRLIFLRKQQLAEQQWAYYFKPVRPLRFVAGQYIEITLNHKNSDNRGVRRRFTIASAPSSDELMIAVRYAEKSSSFKYALRELKPGTVLRATSVNGDFILPKKQQKLLMVAGGIGITPFLSQLESINVQNRMFDITLVYFVSGSSFAVDLSKYKQSNGPNIHVVTESISSELIHTLVPDIAERAVYISGPPRMIDTAIHITRSLGARRITTDLFEGY